MQLSKKHIIIPAAVLVALGLGIGVYFAVSNRNGGREEYIIATDVEEADYGNDFAQVSPNIALEENTYTGIAAPSDYKESGVVTGPLSDEQQAVNIKIPGISNTDIYEGDALNLPNPRDNAQIYLQYTISEDGKTVYKTGLIESSKMVQWVVSKNLEKGEHQLNAYIQGFMKDGNGDWMSLNAASMDFTLNYK